MSPQPVFVIPSSVLSRTVDGELVLLELQTEEYYGLDEVGALIVLRVTELPYEEALASLSAEFGVEASMLHRDIQELAESLISARLLLRQDAATAP